MSADGAYLLPAMELARSLFLRDDNYYGCAESTLVALQTLFGLPGADDSSAAMALNGGVAYSGGVCGAISGAAMAVGRLVESRIDDHQAAKRVTRRLIQKLMAAFVSEFASADCRDLIDYELSIPEEHDAFIESGVWRATCMHLIEFSVWNLSDLADESVWSRAIAELNEPA
ncbi:MAG: hypothetical protein GWP04_00650 [Gammaproteobacteria bacterium]|nr:hypothetical protein [Gammaproteobacteria bacterium]